ncbi:MAG TPA: methyltransferase [Caulobacterales bacterium]|nr:methyltransferase [Caulobacterales bacterium]
MDRNDDLTEDVIYGGRVHLRQPRRGYRVNADTLLLAAAVAPGKRLIELGCGVGGALLAVASRFADARLVGLERDPEFAALARANIAASPWPDRVSVMEGDALAPPDLGTFEGVFFNPPFDPPGEGRAPAASRTATHVADQPLGAWIVAWSNRMTADAWLTLIQRPQRLPEILSSFDGRLGAVDIFPVRPFAGAPARRLIVRARKGSRAPLQLWKGLDLHPGDGADKHTPEAEAILRGEAFIWSA